MHNDVPLKRRVELFAGVIEEVDQDAAEMRAVTTVPVKLRTSLQVLRERISGCWPEPWSAIRQRLDRSEGYQVEGITCRSTWSSQELAAIVFSAPQHLSPGLPFIGSQAEFGIKDIHFDSAKS